MYIKHFYIITAIKATSYLLGLSFYHAIPLG